MVNCANVPLFYYLISTPISTIDIYPHLYYIVNWSMSMIRLNSLASPNALVALNNR